MDLQFYISRWIGRMLKLLLPASVELLVRFPKTEDAIVQ